MLRQAIFDKIRKIKKTGYIYLYISGMYPQGDDATAVAPKFDMNPIPTRRGGGEERFLPPSQSDTSHLNFSRGYVPVILHES